jgi:hypothetical protein
MQHCSRYLVTILFIGTLITLRGAAQVVATDDMFMPHRWDGAHNVAFFGKGLVRKDTRPLSAYADGKARGAPVHLFKDFPHMRSAVVDDFAAAPNGMTIVAAVLNFGSTLRHVLLTYDVSGKLISVLDTEPYYAQAIAADDNGYIYTLGNKLNEKDAKPYSLLVVYDSSGQIVREGLNSNVFKNGSRAVNQNQDAVDPSLMVRDGKLFVYAPVENEILVCLEDGNIVQRVPLEPALSAIRQSEGWKRVSVQNVAFVDENRAVLDIIGYSAEPPTDDRPDPETTRPAAYLLNLTKRLTTPIVRGKLPDWNFLGVKDGQLLMLSAATGKAAIVSHNVPEQ